MTFPFFVRNDTSATDGSIFKFIVDVADSLGVGLDATKPYSDVATLEYLENTNLNFGLRRYQQIKLHLRYLLFDYQNVI